MTTSSHVPRPSACQDQPVAARRRASRRTASTRSRPCSSRSRCTTRSRSPPRRGPVRADVRRSRRARRRAQPRDARRARAVVGPRAGGRAARRRGPPREAHPDAGGPRRRQLRRGRGARRRSRASGAARRPCGPRGRSPRGLGCRRAVLPGRRDGARPVARRRTLSARGSAGRSSWCWRCPRSAWPPRTPTAGSTTTAAAAERAGRRPAGAIAAWRGRRLALVNDLEAPVARRHPEIGAARRVLEAAGAPCGGDDRQRVGGVRAVRGRGGRAAGRQGRGGGGIRGPAHPDR